MRPGHPVTWPARPRSAATSDDDRIRHRTDRAMSAPEQENQTAAELNYSPGFPNARVGTKDGRSHRAHRTTIVSAVRMDDQLGTDASRPPYTSSAAGHRVPPSDWSERRESSPRHELGRVSDIPGASTAIVPGRAPEIASSTGSLQYPSNRVITHRHTRHRRTRADTARRMA